MFPLVGLLDVKRLIKQTRRELGYTLPAGSIRQITAEDSVCIILSLREDRELRIEHRSLGKQQLFILSIQTPLTLPRPISYDHGARCFSTDDPFGRLLNGDAALLRLAQKLAGVTLLPGHRQCLIRAECLPRGFWGTGSPRVKVFLEVVDRIEAILGGVCNQTSELHPVMPGFDAAETTEPNETVKDILSGFDDLSRDFDVAKEAKEAADLKVELTLRQEEVIQGCKKPVTFDRQVLCPACDGHGGEPGSRRAPCPTCKGRGHENEQQGFFILNKKCERCRGSGFAQVKPCRFCEASGIVTKDQTVVVSIPAGVVEGATIRLKGMGNQSAGGEAGDLFVALRIERA